MPITPSTLGELGGGGAGGTTAGRRSPANARGGAPAVDRWRPRVTLIDCGGDFDQFVSVLPNWGLTLWPSVRTCDRFRVPPVINEEPRHTSIKMTSWPDEDRPLAWGSHSQQCRVRWPNSGSDATAFTSVLGHDRVRRVIVTDKLASYVPAVKRGLPTTEHRRHKLLNNRAEDAHPASTETRASPAAFQVHRARAGVPGAGQRCR